MLDNAINMPDMLIKLMFLTTCSMSMGIGSLQQLMTSLAPPAVDPITIALKNVADAQKHKEELAKLGVDTTICM